MFLLGHTCRMTRIWGSPDLGFDVAWSHFDIAWPKFWHTNGVFDQTLGCSGHFDVAREKWAPIAKKCSTGMCWGQSQALIPQRILRMNFLSHF